MNTLAHLDEIVSLDVNPVNQFLLISGSRSGRIKIWDMRKMNQSVNEIQKDNH